MLRFFNAAAKTTVRPRPLTLPLFHIARHPVVPFAPYPITGPGLSYFSSSAIQSKKVFFDARRKAVDAISDILYLIHDNPYNEDTKAIKDAHTLRIELYSVKSQEELDRLLAEPRFKEMLETYTQPDSVLRCKK